MTEAVVIKHGFTEGGRGIGSGTTARHKPLEKAFRAIAADLGNGRVAAIVSPDAVDLATAQTLVNEIKAALNAKSSTVAAPLLPASGAGTYNLSGAGALALTLLVDGASLLFDFQAGDFANVAAATAAECAAAINSRGLLVGAGVLAQDNAGTLELIGNLGGDKTLQGVAGGANAVLGFATVAVNGTGFVALLTAVEG